MSDRTDSTAVVKHAENVESNEVRAGTATRTQVLIGPADGAENFVLRRFVMGPGGGMPRHTNTVEHEQFVLRGRARIEIGAAAHEVRSGNALLIPAGIVHSYEVLEAPFEFLCIVPNAEDRIEIEESQQP